MLDRLLLPWRQPKATEVKAETGIGAFWMANDPPLQSLMQDPATKARKAQAIGVSHRWIRASERVISTTLGSVPWHLETDDDEEVTDESDPVLVSIRDLIEKPYRPIEGEPLRPFPRTRSGLWGITSRHMGLVGYDFWYADAPNPLGIPRDLLYINPARLTPSGTGGNLAGWILDADNRGGGTPLERESVLMFSLEEADEGWFPAGLVETALTLVQITQSSDRHAIGTIGSGGKRPGVFSPKAAAGTIPADVFSQLEKELRASHENPMSWRRDMILRGPVDYVDRAATNEQLDLVALMNMSRDDTLELWGVPRSQLGGTAAVGLNGEGSKQGDEAALWQKAIHPRLERMRETIQFQFLDPISGLIGKEIEIVIDEPTFDDDAPKYALANSATTQPLRNIERRALLGLDPFGDDVLDNAIWLPLNIVEAAVAPPEGKAKADLRPKLAAALNAFLADQKKEIAAKVKTAAKHVAAKPGDSSVWWDGDKWDAKLRKILAPYAQQAADLAVANTTKKLNPGKAGEAADLLGNSVLQRLLAGMGKRITGINETTRQGVIDAIRRGLLEGEGPGTIGDRIEDLPQELFGEYRGELIARTETATVQNMAAVESYREYGVEMVSVIDGDEDEGCAAANGSEWTLEEAQNNPLEHPNCTRDFAPIVGKAAVLSPPSLLPPPALPDPLSDLKAQLTALIDRIDNRPTMGAMTIPAMTLSPVFNMPEALPTPVNIYTPEALPPVVNVTTPEVTVNVPEQPAPVVSVEAPIINVDSAGKAGTVQDVRVVDMPTRTTTATKKVKRDPTTNLITQVTETSVEE